MTDTDRVHRIRSEAQAAIARAQDLQSRVSDPRFKEFVALVVRKLGDIDAFFLKNVESVLPQNEDMWLGGAELFLGLYTDELKKWENVAAARGDDVTLI